MRRLVPVLLALGFALAFPATASGHDVLEKTTPADGTSVPVVPANVVLTFSDEPLELGVQILVKGPAGDVQLGAPVVSGREVTQAVSPTAPAGDYTVAYRVTSGDGHPLSGTISFFASRGLDGSTATAAPSPRPAGGTPSSDSAKESQVVPVLLTVAGTVVFLAVAGYALSRGRASDKA